MVPLHISGTVPGWNDRGEDIRSRLATGPEQLACEPFCRVRVSWSHDFIINNTPYGIFSS